MSRFSQALLYQLLLGQEGVRFTGDAQELEFSQLWAGWLKNNEKLARYGHVSCSEPVSQGWANFINIFRFTESN